MPWHRKTMKDAATCDKPRRAGSKLRPGDVRMGKPDAPQKRVASAGIHTAVAATRGTETSKYPEEKKENSIPLVVASESGAA